MHWNDDVGADRPARCWRLDVLSTSSQTQTHRICQPMLRLLIARHMFGPKSQKCVRLVGARCRTAKDD